MALHCSSAATVAIFKSCISLKKPLFPISISFQNPNSYSTTSTISCTATAKSQTGPINRNKTTTTTTTSSSTSKKKKKKKKNSETLNLDDDFQVLGEFSVDADVRNAVIGSDLSLYNFSDDMPLPEPPTGFSVDKNGVVLLTSTNRLVTIVDPSVNLPLECVIRRVFRNSDRDECMLLNPVDTPVLVLKSTPDGFTDINEEEIEKSILPAAAFALAKVHMHLVHSGFCYTARGGLSYTEGDIIDFHTDDGKEVDGLPSEGVEITYFDLEGSRYLIYTPADPLHFVVVKDENGMFQMADDDMLDDPAVIDAIDEETEFNALVEEEAALIEAMMKGNDDDDDDEEDEED